MQELFLPLKEPRADYGHKKSRPSNKKAAFLEKEIYSASTTNSTSVSLLLPKSIFAL